MSRRGPRRRPRHRPHRRLRRPAPAADLAVPRPGAHPTANSQMVPAHNSGTAVKSAPASSSLLRHWLLVPEADDEDDADYASDDAEWADSPPSEGAGKAPETPNTAPAAASPPPPPREERRPPRPLPPHLALRLRATTEHLARLRLRRQPPPSPPADAPPRKVCFSPRVRVRHLVAWETAARLARRGTWARERADRDRFRRRVAAAEAVIGPCLEPEARARARARIHGPGGPAEEAADSGSAGSGPSGGLGLNQRGGLTRRSSGEPKVRARPLSEETMEGPAYISARGRLRPAAAPAPGGGADQPGAAAPARTPPSRPPRTAPIGRAPACVRRLPGMVIKNF
ncbi:neurovirulence protein ICP34.5 [Chimpanzee herpesvirus strain 105640]|uniref:Neurovirulence factor ICP34.5 n=1 Tax=Chimpanzee herpesvirus strain 105640 TaxID=332937 RepID=K9MHD6_9ALPH|nr:neurovirulence protein ICP34.5 [Chimpanzee herpesvirus strain 105640]YP_009011046.1 neurovirulence protein ICP34.5 [Chimpanzee herpesvirus strain 105640]AFV26887.1 neurovirulence protein ICP34.5 [Chimpanzee herpesvirus strain 105640]AFV26948.1 neurovirulence protein ICP34.5 [Chimpanzee herpesvirus strain 105640]